MDTWTSAASCRRFSVVTCLLSCHDPRVMLRCAVVLQVGLAVAVARKAAPPGCIRGALDPGRKVAVPTAPSAGLIMVSEIPYV